MPVAGPIQSRIRNTKRLAEIIGVLARYGFDGFITNTGLDRAIARGRGLVGRPTEVNHLSHNERLRLVLEELGPVFVKLGQILSTRPDLIPADLADEFRKLQADVQRVDFQRIRGRLDEEFGGRVDELFASIEEVPLAAASMAQVHRAVLKDGSAVVVKVLRPGIESVIESDMQILGELARIAERHFENEGFSPTAVAGEFARELAKEVDLAVEARATERLRLIFDDDPNVSFPRVFRDQSSPRVLTLEHVEGALLADVDPQVLPAEVRRAVVEHGTDAVFRMCLDAGFFHADPHPGNIILQDGGRLCFIDCGMTGHTEARTSRQLAQFVQGVVAGDVEGVMRVIVDLAGADPALELDRGFRTDVAQLINEFQVSGGSLDDLRFGDLLRELFELLRRWRIRCPSDVVFLLKALMTIEGVGRRIDPTFDLVAHVKPLLERRIMERYSARAVRRRFVRSLAAYVDVLEDLPSEIRSLLGLARRKDLAVNLRHEGLERMASTIDRASRTMAYALVFSAVIVASAILILADQARSTMSWLSTLGLAGLGGVAIVALALAAVNFRKMRRGRRGRRG